MHVLQTILQSCTPHLMPGNPPSSPSKSKTNTTSITAPVMILEPWPLPPKLPTILRRGRIVLGRSVEPVVPILLAAVASAIAPPPVERRRPGRRSTELRSDTPDDVFQGGQEEQATSSVSTMTWCSCIPFGEL